MDWAWGENNWMLASFFFYVFIDLDFVWVHKNAKKSLDQYPATSTSRLAKNVYLYQYGDFLAFSAYSSIFSYRMIKLS